MVNIKPYVHEDWPVVEQIYKEGIETGNATFETEPKSESQWLVSSMPDSRLVAWDWDNTIAGWAVMWPVSDRCCYAGVAEVSIYVGAHARGQGVGKVLLNALVETSERMGYWTLQASILKENKGSIGLHKSCGFRQIGIREKLGELNGVWRDVVLMERRSKNIGR
ncbi:GNAT family N-acetyltransferase [Kordiimonas sp. SCSIO 12610]|uniref:GNAT family N-acetyltransferase n=1 Tax=Kordiimonas sp. SCSIO 12610 TaxID=2829597 RepID=UPI00210982FF|nr:GNAT family N-acetyltransferase [Kordiimonas sp. SCSIO 12610]UTW54931.1 N-acetyltransferase [Kordiimonas sp. SCSIO 12610]